MTEPASGAPPREIPLRARAERFGAVVAVAEPPALVAVDRTLARRVGVDGGPLWAGPDPGPDVRVYEGPLEVHLAVTEKCPAACAGCYVDAAPEKAHVPLEALKARLDALGELGAFRVALGGGEAALHPDLGEVIAHGVRCGLELTLTTSGLGMTAARARALAGLAQVNVSHDGVAGDYDRVRGYDGASVADRAISFLVEAGVRVGVNTVLTRETFDGVAALARHVKLLGAVELQLLRWKPGGRATLGYLAKRLTPRQVLGVPALLRALVAQAGLAVRIDCSMVPFLSADPALGVEDVVRLGVSGCEAGRALVTVDAGGGARPCSFWPTSGGTEAGLAAAWAADGDLEACRDHVARAPEPCRSCALRVACRGGCRVVAAHVSGNPWLPDPECPRVLAHGESTRAPTTRRTEAT